MAHALSRLSKSLLEQPQLITQEKFEEIASVLENRDGNLIQLANEAKLLREDSDGFNTQEDLAETTVGILRIEGPLTYKASGFEALCGGASYEDLIRQTQELSSRDDINTILMNIDSGGGEAYRAFESARQIRNIADEGNKKLVAYIDGTASSAAYALASIAHEVVINPDASAGSIGVVVRLTNTTKAEKEAGIETTFITAGDSKVPFDAEGDFREDFLEDVQQRVTELYDNFVQHVASFRDISQEVVRGTEAKVFSAEKALELGLVDKIMEGEEFATFLADLSEERDSTPQQSNSNIIKIETTPSSSEETKMTDNVTPEASVDAALLAKLQATLSKQETQLAAYKAKEEASEKAALSAKLDGYSFLAENKEGVVSFLISEDVSADHKALMDSVLTSAQASVNTVSEEAATKIAAAELATDEANKEKEAIKEEFGEKEHASTEAPQEALSVQETLAAKVAKQKAALAAKA